MTPAANGKSEHLLLENGPPPSDDRRPTSSSATSDAPPENEAHGAMQTIAGVMGNVLEWYDFALFGFFSDVIATVFFAPSDEANDDAGDDAVDYDNMAGGEGEVLEIDTTRLVHSFAVYGGAFLMRPVGGMVIGFIGDKYGRKQALVLSLFLMAIPTFLMGCLPTYAQVGSLSTVLLLVCRLLQGMSVGGQLPASLIYTVEMRPHEHWGFYGALVMMAANTGTLLGNFVGAVMRTLLTEEELVAWGWRIPFLSGILIAFVAIYLRLHGKEHNPNAGEYDDDSQCSRPQESKHPFREVFKRENLPALASATFTPMLWGAGFYTTFVWMAIFMEVLIDPPIEHGFWINGLALLFGIIIPLPLTGMLSDRWGRDRTMGVGIVGLAVLGPVMIKLISSGRGGLRAFFAQWTLGVFLSFFGGPMNAWLVEKFPPKVRLTSAALGYDLAHCTASAFSPLVATLLVREYGNDAPGLMYPFFAVLAVAGMYMSTKIHRDGGMIDEGEVQMAGADGSGTGR
eukprot:CAMPEP_0172540868 /NCGR_PEP_ID=MMETSP1067-20121228/11783_1 /TAXON_ID=265564 ORGANISM="Thalassiosira punctigera, Strain Tpunct2005C2" /NCGR_SAMPLE_ID=MMETSP1067 /ASSEMBLY_ACC=CAM_ASM_000444 /LENGTH=511 /DNA_ID=CAMNT_0013326789 /DNA_START=112 /DNA_END=1644 /DNA_ORIENTATION=+